MDDRTTQQWLLKSRPAGEPTEDNFEWNEQELPALNDGDVRAQVKFLSLDPYMRGRMRDAESYAEPVELGSVMEGESVAEVVESKSEKFKPGDIVCGRGGWQSQWILPADELRETPGKPLPLSYYLGLMGMPGLTAYTGLKRIGKPKEGETVVVAAATGAVGSVVGQIAQRHGCRVVGIAGDHDKCEFLTSELGFDASVSHYDDDMADQLADACPYGIDVYYENVGGKVWEAVLPILNDFARVPVCGLVAWYNADSRDELETKTLMAEMMQATLIHRLQIQGFIVMDTWEEVLPDFLDDMTRWNSEDPFTYKEDITEGLENAPETFIGMLDGDNFGKTLIQVED